MKSLGIQPLFTRMPHSSPLSLMWVMKGVTISKPFSPISQSNSNEHTELVVFLHLYFFGVVKSALDLDGLHAPFLFKGFVVSSPHPPELSGFGSDVHWLLCKERLSAKLEISPYLLVASPSFSRHLLICHSEAFCISTVDETNWPTCPWDGEQGKNHFSRVHFYISPRNIISSFELIIYFHEKERETDTEKIRKNILFWVPGRDDLGERVYGTGGLFVKRSARDEGPTKDIDRKIYKYEERPWLDEERKQRNASRNNYPAIQH